MENIFQTFGGTNLASPPSKPFFRTTTFQLMLINLIVFFFMNMETPGDQLGNYWRFGTLNNVLITLDFQWQRFLTYSFIHANGFHLLLNMINLMFLGGIAEKLLGSLPFVAIYLLGGICSGTISYLSLGIMEENLVQDTMGASGSIFGLAGAFVTHLTLHHKKSASNNLRKMVIRNFSFLIALNLTIGFTIETFYDLRIDNIGHVGGLLGGSVAVILAGLFPNTSKGTKALKHIVFSLVGLHVVGLAFTAHFYMIHALSTPSWYELIQTLFVPR